MKETFQEAVEWALDKEKEWAVDKGGGRTIFGITENFYPIDFQKLFAMTTTEERRAYASEFYYREIWLRFGCDSLPYPMDIVVFDCAINPGPGVARRIVSQGLSWSQAILERQRYYWKKNNPEMIDGPFEAGWINRTLLLYEEITRRLKP